MPRPRKPGNLHVIQGTSPRRRAFGEPKAAHELGSPPTRLGRRERRVWHEIAAFFPDGTVYGAADRFAIERYCTALIRWRDTDELLRSQGLLVDGRLGDRVRNPLTIVLNRLGEELDRLATQLALSPLARTTQTKP